MKLAYVSPSIWARGKFLAVEMLPPDPKEAYRHYASFILGRTQNASIYTLICHGIITSFVYWIPENCSALYLWFLKLPKAHFLYYGTHVSYHSL